jgi:hypothetical protein
VVTNRDTSLSLTKILLQFCYSCMIAPSLLPASRTSRPVHSWEADPLPIYTGIHANPDVVVDDAGQIAWALRKNSPKLAEIRERGFCM